MRALNRFAASGVAQHVSFKDHRQPLHDPFGIAADSRVESAVERELVRRLVHERVAEVALNRVRRGGEHALRPVVGEN